MSAWQRKRTTVRTRRLTKREALVLRELIRAERAVVDAQELAWALGDQSPNGKFHVHNIVGSVRRKFGEGVVETVSNVERKDRGYRAGPELLRVGRMVAA